MHAAWRKRAEEAEAALTEAQVQARMDLQAMQAERDAAQHLECAVAGMLRETEASLAAMTAERDDAMAENAILARYRLSLSEALAERDAALADALALRGALCMIYDRWEDGTSCCDESGADLGNALRLDKAEEDSILALVAAGIKAEFHEVFK